MATFSGQAMAAMRRTTNGASTADHAAVVEMRDTGFRDLVFSTVDNHRGNQPFDMAAGASFRLAATFERNAAVGTPDAGNVEVRVWVMDDNTGAVLREVTVITLAGGFATGMHTGEATFYATHDGTSTGSPRAGTFRIGISVYYAQSTADAVNGGYTATSNNFYSLSGTPNTWASSLMRQDVGYVRASTTATLTPSSVDAAYGEVVALTVDLAAPALNARTLTLVLGPSSGASNNVTDGHTRNITINNVFPAAETVYTPSITVPNDSLSGIPWTVLTVTTQDVTVDPRLTVDHHMQVNNNVLDAALDRTSRLTSDLGFVGFRLVNANGTGVNGITCTHQLRDADALADYAVNRSIATATVNSLDGWSTLATWDSALPGGVWDHTVAITAPSGATGLAVGGAGEFTLLAPNPAYRVLVGGGPDEATNPDSDKDHWHPGDPLLIGLALFDTTTGQLLTPDASPAPSVYVGRFNQAFGRAEYYDSDGTWKSAGGGATAHDWPLSVSPGDPQTFVAVLAAVDTTDWTWADIFLVGVVYHNGTPYSGPGNVPVLDTFNPHSSLAFDPTGLFA